MYTTYKALFAKSRKPSWEVTSCTLPKAGEVCIHVVAAGINRADLSQLAGSYPPPSGASHVLGLECSGYISAVGRQVKNWQVGDQVCALLSGGGIAEQVVCSEDLLLPIPQGFSILEAASLPEVYATAWLNLYRLAKLKPGENLLLYAAASGVGCAALQMATILGNPVTAVVGSEGKRQTVLTLGAKKAFNRHKEIESLLLAEKPFDVILDPSGAGFFPLNQRLLNRDGRLVIIGLLGGRHTEVDLGLLLMKRQRLLGSTLRSRPITEKKILLKDLQAQIWPLIESQKILLTIDSVFCADKINEAFSHMSSCGNQGKILIKF